MLSRQKLPFRNRSAESRARHVRSRLRLAEALTSGATHPLPVRRAAELDKWARSPQFRGLLERGAPLRRPAGAEAVEAAATAA